MQYVMKDNQEETNGQKTFELKIRTKDLGYRTGPFWGLGKD